MEFVIKFRNGQKEVWHVVAPENLSIKVKPPFVNQFKALTSKIDEGEDELFSAASVRVVQFLENCYKSTYH